MAHLLEVRNLSVRFHTAHGIVDAVRTSAGTSTAARPSPSSASGSGKSVSSSAIMNLIDCPPGEITSGEVLFDGRDLSRPAPPSAARSTASGSR